MAVLTGRPEVARRDLANAGLQRAPHLVEITGLSEFDVLLELGDVDAFWKRWHELGPQLERHWHYWLHAGVCGGNPPTLDIARARAWRARVCVYAGASLADGGAERLGARLPGNSVPGSSGRSMSRRTPRPHAAP